MEQPIIPVYIIPIVNVDPNNVIININENNEDVDAVETVSNNIDTVQNDKNSYKYTYYSWKKFDNNGGLINFKRYFSGFCNTMCSEEIKASLAQHFSLWESCLNIDNLENKFIIVIEDDNIINETIDFTIFLNSMIKNNIDILQLREIFYNGNIRNRINDDPPIYTYNGGYDISLSAYIIRLTKAVDLIKEIQSIGGISTGLYLELYKIEKDKNINRQILNNSSDYITNDSRLLVSKRIYKMKDGFWNRIGIWMAKRFPNITFTLTNPLFSFFGLFDINVIGIIIISIITILLMFDINSKTLWLISGAMITYII
nr:IMV heparin binding surface protein [Wadden Sea poxvirus]